MRDKQKELKYWDDYLANFQESIARRNEKLNRGLISTERINTVKQDMVWSHLVLIIAKYSAGNLIDSLKVDLANAISLTYESWDGFWKIKAGGPTGSIVLNQYGIDAYDQMVWMLSLGYLLNIDGTDFNKLVDVIDRDKVRDYLFEFIIKAKIKDRPPIVEESYQEFFGVPNSFEKLRQAIQESDKAKAEKLVKEFITKDWYKNHKDAGWYNSHKSKHHTYFGYWSFETAAIVKIMGLNDAGFRDCVYYPKDLV